MPRKKGWVREPARHSLAALGIKTTSPMESMYTKRDWTSKYKTEYSKDYKAPVIKTHEDAFKWIRKSGNWNWFRGTEFVKALKANKKYWSDIGLEFNTIFESDFSTKIQTLGPKYVDGIYLLPSKRKDSKLGLELMAHELEADEITWEKKKGVKYLRMWWD